MSFWVLTYLMQKSIFEKDISINIKRYLHFNRDIYISNRGICIVIQISLFEMKISLFHVEIDIYIYL